MTTTYVRTTIVAITCNAGGCGLVFGLDEEFIKARQRDHATWYCPNGHPRYWPQKNAEEAAKARAEQLSDELARANTRALRNQQAYEHERRRLAAAKGRITKLKKRIANGICPCCNRYFRALHDHVAKEHPDYVLPEGVTLDAQTDD